MSDIPENSFVEESQDEGGPSNLSKDVLPNTLVLESDEELQPHVIDNETVFAAEKILKHRIVDGKINISLSGLVILKTRPHGSQKRMSVVNG